jgi:hypothetical protein
MRDRLQSIPLTGFELLNSECWSILTSKTKQSGVNRRALQNKRSGIRSIRPSQLKSNIMLSHTYRFVSTSGTSTSVTPNTLCFAAGAICVVSNSTVASCYDSVKINRVEIYTPPASQGSSATCSLNWESSGSGFAPNMEVSDTSVSVADPAYINCIPPPRSVSGFWNLFADTSVLFTVVAPTGSIIDVHLSLILADNGVENSTNGSITTGTLGVMYYLSLDSNSTHRFTPVSLTTTT